MSLFLLCLGVLLAAGLAEQATAWRSRRAVPIRIHVNGTRGKSTVTRLVAAALREAGIPALAKVTGTAPRLILPDGVEQPIARRAPANIREQAWVLRRARRARARALVVECMAIRPDLQAASERRLLRSTIGVITNVRLDHTEVMGTTREEIAASLAGTVPERAVLVTGAAQFERLLTARCAKVGTRLVVVHAGGEAEGAVPASPAPWLAQDEAIALAVTRELGIDDEIARRGMLRAAPDPGAMKGGVATIASRSIEWVDATAANDPDSLDLLLGPALAVNAVDGPVPGATQAATRRAILVYNHRSDRAPRLAAFAAESAAFEHASSILVTGERPSLSLLARLRRIETSPGPQAGTSEGRRDAERVRFVRPSRLTATLGRALAQPGSASLVVFCGNTRGFENPLR